MDTLAPEIIARTRARLRLFAGRYPDVCRRSGLKYSWLTKFARGARGQRPSFALMHKLQAVLDELEGAATSANGEVSAPKA